MRDPWYFKYLRTQINRIWGWDPERKKAKRRASIGTELFKCEKCGAQPLTAKQKEVDHIVSREAHGVFDGWDNYIRRTFVNAEGLQILCKPCHHSKSALENNARRKAKKEAKNG